MNDQLILVDLNNEIVGYDDKETCHHGMGKLHRAFSILIFNRQGQLLLQQRSAMKRLWPLYWSNSVCSHPRKGELMEVAARRRLMEELGIRTAIDFLYTFNYHARYLDMGSESEVCSVYYGFYDGKIEVNHREVKAIKFIDAAIVGEKIEESPDIFTPWFKMEWQSIESRFMDRIKASREVY